MAIMFIINPQESANKSAASVKTDIELALRPKNISVAKNIKFIITTVISPHLAFALSFS